MGKHFGPHIVGSVAMEPLGWRGEGVAGHWDFPAHGGNFWSHVNAGTGFLYIGLRCFAQFVYENTVERHLPYYPRALHSRFDIALLGCVSLVGMLGELNNGHFFTWAVSGLGSKVGGDHMLYAWVQEAHALTSDGLPQEGWVHSNINNLQHVLVYFSYLLVAIFALLERACPQHVSSHLGMLMLIVALLLDGFQMYIHSIAKEAVHCMQHMLFAVLSFAAALVCISELWCAKRVLLGARSFLFTITGVWFLTMGTLMKTGWPVDIVFFGVGGNTILHHDTTQLRAGPMMMLNAALFSAECLVVLLVLICVYIIARKQLLSRVMQDDNGVYDTVTSSLGPSSHGGSPEINVEVFSSPV